MAILLNIQSRHPEQGNGEVWKIIKQGIQAWHDGETEADNPYPLHDDCHDYWLIGYIGKKQEWEFEV